MKFSAVNKTCVLKKSEASTDYCRVWQKYFQVNACLHYGFLEHYNFIDYIKTVKLYAAAMGN